MCTDCLKEKMPDRGSTCLEGGAYMLNYAGCCKCQSRGFLGEEGRVRSVGGGEGMEGDSGNEGDGEEEEETISFKHVCKECQHVVATHHYTFSTSGDYQDYSMKCHLCGHGSANVSVLPDDPREKPLF